MPNNKKLTSSPPIYHGGFVCKISAKDAEQFNLTKGSQVKMIFTTSDLFKAMQTKTSPAAKVISCINDNTKY